MHGPRGSEPLRYIGDTLLLASSPAERSTDRNIFHERTVTVRGLQPVLEAEGKILVP